MKAQSLNDSVSLSLKLSCLRLESILSKELARIFKGLHFIVDLA